MDVDGEALTENLIRPKPEFLPEGDVLHHGKLRLRHFDFRTRKASIGVKVVMGMRRKPEGQ